MIGLMIGLESMAGDHEHDMVGATANELVVLVFLRGFGAKTELAYSDDSTPLAQPEQLIP